MVAQRSAFRAASIATVIASLLLAACGAGATSSPASTQSAPQTAAPTATTALEAAPAFVRGAQIQTIPGDWMSLAVGDLNEDSKPDLITITQSRLGVAAFLGRGDGTFDAAPDIEVATGDFVKAADVDGDGHVDLLEAGDQMAVLRGRGDGTFDAPVYYAAGKTVTGADINLFGLEIADLNADKITDLIVANYGGSQLAVLLGKGDGTFDPASLYPCPNCAEPVAGDLNGDGAVDVVVTRAYPGIAPQPLYAFLNDGKGRLRDPVGYDPRGNAVGVTLADLNHDGALDVITANDGSDSVSVLLGKGDGTFAEAQTYTAGNTHVVAVVDLDGDGKLDVLSGSADIPKVWFYRGMGDGRLIETQGIDTAPNTSNGMAVADLNGDGKFDLAVSSTDGHGLIAVFLGK